MDKIDPRRNDKANGKFLGHTPFSVPPLILWLPVDSASNSAKTLAHPEVACRVRVAFQGLHGSPHRHAFRIKASYFSSFGLIIRCFLWPKSMQDRSTISIYAANPPIPVS